MSGFIPAPQLDMFWVVVGFKAFRDAVADLQQTCTGVLELLLIRQTLIWFVQLLQSLFHRPHAFLTLDTKSKTRLFITFRERKKPKLLNFFGKSRRSQH